MQITLNGEVKEIQDDITIVALLVELRIQKERVAVELNLNIVPKNRFAETVLNDGDMVEIVSFVGGG